MTSPAARHRALAEVHRGSIALALLIAAGLGAALGPVAPAEGGDPPSAEVVMPDTGAAVAELVEVVRGAAAAVPDTEPARDLRVVFTDTIEDPDGGGAFLAGQQRGATVLVRIDGIAMPTRTLLHELSHAFTPGTGHGDPFRAVYLAAIAEVYDDTVAAREARRLAWVYDRCYLDDSCPVLETTARPSVDGPTCTEETTACDASLLPPP